jgi:hypothetical protein
VPRRSEVTTTRSSRYSSYSGTEKRSSTVPLSAVPRVLGTWMNASSRAVTSGASARNASAEKSVVPAKGRVPLKRAGSPSARSASKDSMGWFVRASRSVTVARARGRWRSVTSMR